MAVKRVGLVPLAALLGGLTLSACGGEESTGPIQSAPPGVASVVVTPGADTLVFLGEQAQLRASAREANGNVVSDKTFTWASSDESVATVSASGLVTAKANGSATITVTTDGINGTARILVDQTTASVVVTPAAATLVSLGETLQLSASTVDAGGSAVPGESVTWSSDEETVATVSSAGLVTAVANGSATITATVDGISGTTTILVDQVPVQLAFTVEPTTKKARDSIAPAVEVAIQDAAGNTVSDATDAVTVAIGTNPGGGTLSGTTTVTAVNGIATFADLKVDEAGTGYTLVATSGTLTPAASATFDVIFTLSGFGAATIDGAFGAGEWDNAGRIDFLANLPPDDGGGTTATMLLVMNDATNLYLALKITRSSFGGATNPVFEFDNNGDGVRDEGDDSFGMAVGTFLPVEFRDVFRTTQPPCPSGSVCGFLDVDVGGTTDGAAAASNDGSFTYIEISHPLDSSDDAHDFSLASGDIAGFTLSLRLFSLDTNCSFGSDCFADTDFPTSPSNPGLFGGILVESQ